MKFSLIIPALVLLSILIGCSTIEAKVADPFLENKVFLTAGQAEKRWGIAPFSAKHFRTSTTKERASMAVNLLKSKQYMGKSPARVRKELGEFTGYFWSDNIPAYLIEEGWHQKRNTWQIIFLLNQKGVVHELRIHKNCCDNK